MVAAEPLSEDSFDDVTGILSASFEHLNCEAEAILESIRSEKAEPTRSRTASTEDRWDGSDHDDELEDEMNDEILKLGSVTANLQKEMEDISVERVLSNMTGLNKAPQEEEEMKAPCQEELAPDLHFLQRSNLYGPGVGGKELNIGLVASASIVWTVLAVLALHVRYAGLNENGTLHWTPTLF